MAELPPSVAGWLTGPDGRRCVAEAVAALDAGQDEIRVGARLRGQGLAGERAAAVTGVAIARRRARERWPDADRLLFTREALEQASDPEVSAWRAQRFAGAETHDLCAGVGGDTMALAQATPRVTAVESDPARVALLRHNLAARGHDIEVVAGDALAVSVPADAFVHVDPGRRRDGRRAHRLAAYQPPVPQLLARHRPAGLAVVLSPGVSWEDPDLPAEVELEFVQVGDTVTEAVAWLGALRRTGATASATLLPDGHHRARSAERETLAAGPVGNVLVEVVGAAVRARLHDDLGREIGARRLAARRALLTSDHPPPASPWYRVRAVEAVLPLRPAAVRRWLAAAEEQPIEIAVHGLDADPVAWWRALGRPPRGPKGRRVELVRTDDGAIAIVCRDQDHPEGRAEATAGFTPS